MAAAGPCGNGGSDRAHVQRGKPGLMVGKEGEDLAAASFWCVDQGAEGRMSIIYPLCTCVRSKLLPRGEQKCDTTIPPH